MAPLGTLPSQKVLKSVSKAEGRDCAGRVKRSEASNATTPTSETPDLPLSFATRRQSQSPRPLEEVNSPPRTPAAQKSPQLVEGEEMVKQPDLEKETLPSSETPAPPESPLPGPPTRRTTRSMSVQTPAPYDRTAPPTPEYDEDGLAYTDPDFTDKVIQDAVDKALEYRRLPTAYALRTLHDERSNDNVYLRLVESVYYQRASQKEMGEFNKMLTERKRVGRKNREAEYYFNGDGSDPDPPLARPVLKAVCAALTYDTPNLNKPDTPHLNGDSVSAPATRARRSDSISSSSSLSSVDEDVIQSDLVDLTPASPDQAKSPVKRRLGRAPRESTGDTPSAQGAKQQTKIRFTKFQGKGKKLNPPEDDIEEREKNEETNKLKRKARATTNQGGSAPESFVRGSHNRPPLIDVDTASEGGEYVSFKLQSRQENKRKRSSVIPNTRETRQRLNHDDSQHSSPTHLGFQQDLPPGSVPGSRAGTPAAGGRPTRKAKTGSGLRVKTSPVKKKGGIVAGIPRASGERSSPSGHGGPPENKDDNDDYCAACGGNGDLVCCDGCNRSFHFKCVDPPMIEGALPDAWYCNSCNCKFNPQPIEERTNPAFGLLLQNLQSKNPSAFHLPKSIREYFEGVQTGAEGEYEEPAPPKPKNNGHVEIENTPDDEEDEPKGFYEETQFGTVYKLPEEGLKLDFISKVKARGGGISRSGVLNGQMAARPAPVQAARSLVEQQAALNLLALSIPESDRTVGGLISTLLDEAPPAVFEMLAKVDTSAAQASKKLSSKEREKLRPLQSWLNNYMAAGNVEQDEDEDKEVPALTDSAVSQNTDELDEDTAMTL
ncbi:hypothetical protein BJ875DRAFT_370497 [Amylocarpus encephaloides]|uniref:PHD-type domain-containing protein n=1 Tax=Amylocarpus encephaloides TaxID=45428 RepID=A0A9P7YPW7_9HELO|nr:hypothetical protein BJ875DRAFT_370497 [Amylocarpus encephaloides]